MSSLETELFYLAEFSDSVVDIREQFPLFPLDLSIKIAKSLDIAHPKHPETGVPIIITTDFLLTRKIDNEIVYEAIFVKAKNESNNLRVLEKLEIERVWWDLLEVKFSYFTGTELTQIQSSNINWATHPYRTDSKRYSQNELEMALTLVASGKHFTCEICNDFVRKLDMNHEDAQNLLRCLIAQKYLIVDISYPLDNSDYIDVLDKVCIQKVMINGSL